jgi:hypothetical protein
MGLAIIIVSISENSKPSSCISLRKLCEYWFQLMLDGVARGGKRLAEGLTPKSLATLTGSPKAESAGPYKTVSRPSPPITSPNNSALHLRVNLQYLIHRLPDRS